MSAFDDLLNATLAQRGVTIGPDGRMTRLSGYTGPEHVTDEFIR